MNKGDKVKVSIDKDKMSDMMADLEMNLTDRTISSRLYDIIGYALYNEDTVWEIMDEEKPDGFLIGVSKGKSLVAAPFLFEESCLQLIQ